MTEVLHLGVCLRAKKTNKQKKQNNWTVCRRERDCLLNARKWPNEAELAASALFVKCPTARVEQLLSSLVRDGGSPADSQRDKWGEQNLTELEEEVLKLLETVNVSDSDASLCPVQSCEFTLSANVEISFDVNSNRLWWKSRRAGEGKQCRCSVCVILSGTRCWSFSHS